jgi:hypothetical protein
MAQADPTQFDPCILSWSDRKLTVGFVAHAFIGPIGDRHGFGWLSTGRLFAWMTESQFPDDLISALEGGYRLRTEGRIEVRDFGGGRTSPPRLSVKQSGGHEFFGKHGYINCLVDGLLQGFERASEQQFTLEPTEGPQAIWTWRLIAHGQPARRFEPGFLLGGRRQSSKIWHALEVQLDLRHAQAPTFGVRFTGQSAFPSHKLWRVREGEEQGRDLGSILQAEFSRLWRSAPPPPDLDATFVQML